MKKFLFSFSLLACLASFSLAEPKFKKITLDDKFRSEGVGIGDFNKDGKNDVVVGEVWYEAPKWTPHEI
ncbi:uncharacterized protein METZ01_LOCUS289588, partial [marine metagenome]